MSEHPTTTRCGGPARNCAELRQHPQQKTQWMEPSIGPGDFDLGSPATGSSGQASGRASPLAPATPKLSRSAPRAEESRGLAFRIAEARSSQAGVFDRAWLDGIKSRRQPGSTGTLCLGGERRQGWCRAWQCGLRGTKVDRTASTQTSYPEIVVQGGQQLDAMPAAGASLVGPSGGAEGAAEGTRGSQKKKEEEQANVVRAYPPWNEDQQSSLQPDAWKTMIESVLRQTAGCGGGGESSRSFERPWYPSQWEAFQVRRNLWVQRSRVERAVVSWSSAS